ncbi:MAG: hypothetical protein ACRD8O_02975, partial [Bryobacteraceae bacterium]
MIYTFYSYKGGVGRSMALANLAEAFHERGLRVLVVDWDLEAPGLESYFRSAQDGTNGEVRTSLARPGLLDMLNEYRSAFPRLQASRAAEAVVAAAPDPVQYARQIQEAAAQTQALLQELASVPQFLKKPVPEEGTPTELGAFLRGVYQSDQLPTAAFPDPLSNSPLRGYLQCLHPPESERRNGLYLLSAGARDEDRFGTYAEAVQEFDWVDFYVSCEGSRYFTWFRDELNSIADVVLIDSRTGVTEMGGVCTRHVPDAVVAFCAPNIQNVEGVLRVVSGVN